jgi:hypothetical protein
VKHKTSRVFRPYLEFESPNGRSKLLNVIFILKYPWRSDSFFFWIGEKNTSIRWCRNHKYRLRLWCFAKYKIFRILHSYLKFKSLNDWFKPLNMIFILKYILRSNETWQILYFTKHHSPPLSIYIFPSPSKLMKGKTIFF